MSQEQWAYDIFSCIFAYPVTHEHIIDQHLIIQVCELQMVPLDERWTARMFLCLSLKLIKPGIQQLLVIIKLAQFAILGKLLFN